MTHAPGKYADFEGLRERAVALRRAGLSRRQIRDRLHVDNNDLLNRLLEGEPPPAWTKRPNAKDDLREKARELRLQGWTYDQIQVELGCGKSSISLWVRDLPKPERQRSTEEASAIARRGWEVTLQRREEERQHTKAVAQQTVGDLTDREVFLAGVVLYWAEGAKDKSYSRRERLQFINSDPNVICFFLRWLDVLGVERERLRFRVSIHESANVQEAEEFWAGLLRRGTRHAPEGHSQEAQPEDKPQEHLGGISRLPDRLRAQERRLVPSHGRRLVRHSRRRRSAT